MTSSFLKCFLILYSPVPRLLLKLKILNIDLKQKLMTQEIFSVFDVVSICLSILVTYVRGGVQVSFQKSFISSILILLHLTTYRKKIVKPSILHKKGSSPHNLFLFYLLHRNIKMLIQKRNLRVYKINAKHMEESNYVQKEQ